MDPETTGTAPTPPGGDAPSPGSAAPVSLSSLGALDAPARSGWVAMLYTNGDKDVINGLTAAQVFDIEQQVKANRHGAIQFHDQSGDWMSVLGTYVRAFATSSGVKPEAGEGLPRA